MRILHVIRSADPAGGGPIESVMRLGIEHQQQGRSIEVLSLDAPDAPWWVTFPLKHHAIGPVATKYGYTSRLLPWLRDRAADFDLIIVNGLWQYVGLATWRFSRRSGVPYVVFPHGMLDPWFKRRYPLKHVKKWMYWPWAEYRILRDAAAVFFTSEDERRLAQESFGLYRCREVVSNYGTARPPDDACRQRAAFYKAFPEAAAVRLILFLGRVHEKKGCDHLVKAFGSLMQNGHGGGPWRLLLAGPTGDVRFERWLRQLIGQRCPTGSVVRTGMLSGDLKWGAFRAADAFILPSHQENFGVAVAEALGCGLPVLLSDKVNIWREVIGDEAGLAEADGDDGTRRLLERWMTLDDGTRQRMRENAARCFERFDARRVARHIGSCLESLI